MRKKHLLMALLVVAFGIFCSRIVPSSAGEDTDQLKKQIEDLRNEVNALKASQRSSPQMRILDQPTAGGYSSFGYSDPFEELSRMQDHMGRLFRDSFNRSSGLSGLYEPDLDIQDKKDYYVMSLDLPGLEKDKINIEITEHDITVSGERSYESERQDDIQGFYRMERSFGSFSRRLPLPEDATPEGVEANYEKGVLEIKIAKKEIVEKKGKAKRVTVK